MDKNSKFLVKRKIERKLAILEQLRSYSPELYKERLSIEKPELLRLTKEFVSISPKLFQEDLDLIDKVMNVITEKV